MRFLVDAQLPPASPASFLEELGHDAQHVVDLGLENASDAAIWDTASALSAIIVTKDEDFRALRVRQGRGPTGDLDSDRQYHDAGSS